MSPLRAFSTLGCPEFSLSAALALAEHHGIDAIEARTLGGTADLPAYFQREFGSPAALAARMKTSPVGLVSLDTSWALAAEPSAAERAQFLAFLPWAEALGIAWLRVFDLTGSVPGQPMDRNFLIARMAESVAWWRAERRAHGWRADIMVETHDVITDTPSIGSFVAQAPGTAILWDTHHTWRQGEDPVATWQSIRPWVVHVHVKDSAGRPGGRPPFAYVLPGKGDFPMAQLLAALDSYGFGGTVSLEWERYWHPTLPPLEAALTAAAAHRWW